MCIACELAMMDVMNYVEGKQSPLPDDTLKFAVDSPDVEKPKPPQEPKVEESKP